MTRQNLLRLALAAALAFGLWLAPGREAAAQCPEGWELVGETEDEYLCSPIEEAGPSEEGMAERRSRAVAAWRQLMNGYRDLTDPDAEWRVKWQAWWNDPMHQAWVGDAMIIASLPLLAADALAVGRGLLGTGTGAAARKAVQHTLAKPPRWTTTVGRGVQMQAARRAPAARYYKFPTHIRSEIQPKIPKWLFIENPYKPVHPGSRTWVWMDAANVRIRRTPEMDKELKWVLSGVGHF